MAANAVTNPPNRRDNDVGSLAWRAIHLAPRFLLVAIICYVSTELGFANKVPPHNISALWPTNAILVAILVVTPIRDWWVYVVAAYFSSVINDGRAGFPISAILFLAAALIEAFVAAVGIRRFADGVRAFESLRTLVAYIIVAVVLAPFVSSFVAAFAGGLDGYWFYWRIWFLGEALAFLTLAPAILTWIRAVRIGSISRHSLSRLIEACLLGCALLAICIGVFIWAPPIEGSVPTLVYLPLPVLVWAAVRFGPLGVNTSLLVVALFSISSTVQGRGPFATSGLTENVIPLQLFLAVISLPLMFLAALIAERREKTNVLSESEARFRSMADTAPVLIWMSGQNKLCDFFNQRWLEFTGQTMEHELGYGWAKGIHPDDAERSLATYVGAFDARREFTMEYRLRRHDGEYRWVLDKGIPRLTPDGTFLGYIGCADDITERKLAEQRAWQVLESAPNAMVVVNQEGKIVLVNAEVERVFGYRRDELIGGPVELLLPERFRPYHPRDRTGYFADPKSRAMGAGRELFGLRKDGSEVPIEIGLNPIRTPEGLIVLASIIDITARKEAESEMHRHRAELAHVARIATMGELAASLAHELNQPLAAILTNAEAVRCLLDTKPVQLNEVREIVNDIRDVADHAGEVVHGLRAFVKKEPPVTAPIDLASVVREVVRLAHSDAVQQNCHLSIKIDPDLPLVQGDRVQLQQVVLNLLMNAFDAMRDYPVHERHVVVGADLVDNHAVRLSIRDSGTGLSPDGLSRIFQPFYTTKHEGLGMGLSISRTIVEANGGRLWAENNSDRGATFHVTIPLGNQQ